METALDIGSCIDCGAVALFKNGPLLIKVRVKTYEVRIKTS